MTISLPAKPDINLLKKQAKKLLKQYRSNNSEAMSSIQSFHPRPESFNGLRDAQLVVARRYGFISWAELTDAVQMAAYAQQSLEQKANTFIGLGCVQYNGNDRLRNYQRAQELLERYPDIAKFSFYSALVANNANVVSEYLSNEPELVNKTGGPLNWPPLLYVTYGRIKESSGIKNAIVNAQLLLAKGAEPDTNIILNETYRFSALTGAMGEGEGGENQPSHQYAEELAAILLKAGANPNEGQGLYNTMFSSSGDRWLALLIDHGLQAKHKLNWQNKESAQTTLDYQLANAVSGGYEKRVKILLSAGANPNATDGYNGRRVHTNALLRGHMAIASLLAEVGAEQQKLSPEDQFRMACVNEDTGAIVVLLSQWPSLKNDASLLHDAVFHCDTKIFKFLIELGFDINGQANYGRTILHHFALNNDAEQVIYLLGKGARFDVEDDSHHSTAVGFAAYNGSYDVLKLLLDESDNFLEVVCCGYLERATSLLNQDSTLVHQRSPQGNTPLHVIGAWLSEELDYTLCEAFVNLLLSAGADANAKNHNGQTPIELSIELGAEIIAILLDEVSGQHS